jgi:hypothetical protein
MQRFVCTMFIVCLAVASLNGQEKTSPSLRVSCSASKHSYAAGDAVDLTITLENVGSTDFYIYRNVEWGWAGIGFKLFDAKGKVVQSKQRSTPPPPPPVYDKTQLVSLARGYFYGTHLAFDLSHYALEPGAYYVEVLYRSNYREESGFGLPILTFADGEFLSNRVPIEILAK